MNKPEGEPDSPADEDQLPFGLGLIASGLTLVGGFALFMLLFEVIDSIRFGGLSSLAIKGPKALAGFLLYGGLPLLVYATGIALFSLRRWAYLCAVFILPVYGLFYYLHLALARIHRIDPMLTGRPIDLFRAHPDIVFNQFLQYLLLLIPLSFYLTRGSIRQIFRQKQKS